MRLSAAVVAAVGLFVVADGATVSKNARCGKVAGGSTCLNSQWGSCCSQYGWCGRTADYCAPSKGCQSKFGTCTGSDSATKVSKDGQCGGNSGQTCQGSVFGNCCSQHGWCGSTSAYCATGCQSKFGTCKGSVSSAVTSSTTRRSTLSTSTRTSSPSASPSQPVSTNARCGKAFGGQTCKGSRWGDCCSQYSYCGSTDDYCRADSCQAGYGLCKPFSVSTSRSSTRTSTSSYRSSSTTARSSSSSPITSPTTSSSSSIFTSTTHSSTTPTSTSSSTSSMVTSNSSSSTESTSTSTTLSSLSTTSSAQTSSETPSSTSSSTPIEIPSTSTASASTPTPSVCLLESVTNGDFASGSFEPWTVEEGLNAGFGVPRVTANALEYPSSSGSGNPFLSQQLSNLPAGSVVECSLKYKNPGVSQQMSIVVRFGDVTCIESIVDADTRDWTVLQGQATTDLEDPQILIIISYATNGPSSIFLDDISVSVTGACPSPVSSSVSSTSVISSTSTSSQPVTTTSSLSSSETTSSTVDTLSTSSDVSSTIPEIPSTTSDVSSSTTSETPSPTSSDIATTPTEPPIPTPTSLLANPSFEEDPPVWQYNGVALRPSTGFLPSDPHTGARSFEVGSLAPSTWNFVLYQSVTVIPGRTYNVQAWIKQAGPVTSCTMTFRFLTALSSTAYRPTSEYALYSWTIVADVAETTLYLQATCSRGGPLMKVNVDDVVMTLVE